MLLQPGRDIGMGLRVDIGIDTQGDGGLDLHICRDAVDLSQFIFGFHVEHQDLAFQGKPDLFSSLANPGINDLLCGNARLQRPEELSARHNISAGAMFRKETYEGGIGIGLKSEADDMAFAVERLVISLEVPDKGTGAVNINRGAVFSDDLPDRYIFRIEFAFFILEKMHDRPLI